MPAAALQLDASATLQADAADGDVCSPATPLAAWPAQLDGCVRGGGKGCGAILLCLALLCPLLLLLLLLPLVIQRLEG